VRDGRASGTTLRGEPASTASSANDDARVRSFRERIATMAGGAVLGTFSRLYGSFWIAIAAVVLVAAWQAAPQRLIDAHRFAAFTAHADGRIVESWLALEWDPADMGDHLRWHAYAKAAPCAVVEFDAAGEWGRLRRAYCGNRFMLREEDSLESIRTLAPGVPFDWLRDGRGFIVPEVRVSAASRAWLASHAPWSTFMMGSPAPATALAALAVQVDSPVDAAIVSWSAPPPAIPLVFDPHEPVDALPAAYVDARRAFSPGAWATFAFAAAIGVVVWLAGMRMILGTAMPPRARIALSLLPLATVPLWSEAFPDMLHRIHRDIGAIAGDMIGDVGRTERLVATDPAAATLAAGERLVFPVATGVYADTFGRFEFVVPQPPPASDDDALVALSASITRQLRALPVDEQAAIFARLEHDKAAGWPRAGAAFVPAAREIVLDSAAAPALRRAARRFLSAWTTQPIEEPHRSRPAYRARLAQFQSLAALPIDDVSIMAASVVERAKAP
jgi:hypothetical protein